MMDLVEAMVVFVTEKVHGGHRFTYQGHEIDVTPPWRRMTLREAILAESGVDYAAYPEATDLIAAGRAAGADIEPGTVWPRIVDELLKQFVRPKLIQPTFLIDYPVPLSPWRSGSRTIRRTSSDSSRTSAAARSATPSPS